MGGKGISFKRSTKTHLKGTRNVPYGYSDDRPQYSMGQCKQVALALVWDGCLSYVG